MRKRVKQMPTWEELRESCLNCQKCRLAETRTNVVFGVGSETSPILFIGEGPGEQEDLRGEPFVGRAGKLLDQMLGIIGLDRSRIYIANIVKCRPPQNRDPLPEEQEACIGYLRAQTALLRPKLIVCLGRIAAMKIISPTFKISADHGKWFDRAGVRMMALYHPAALLRDPRRKEETLPDLYAIEEELKKLGFYE